MTTQLFTFQNRTLKAHYIDGQIWFESADIAKALGYSYQRSIAGLYANYKSEFAEGMSLITESMTNGINNSLRKIKTRIFSLRGVHLIAMFARTPAAEEFRKWVLDLIDKEIATPTKRRGPYAKKHADLPAGVYHCQSKYNPYRATAWDGKTSVHVGSYPTVDDAVRAINHFHKTGVVQRLQAKRLTQSIEVTPLLNIKSAYPVDKTDFVNHLKTILEAAQLLSCYEYGKELAWDLVAFSQEEAQRFTQPA